MIKETNFLYHYLVQNKISNYKLRQNLFLTKDTHFVPFYFPKNMLKDKFFQMHNG